MIFVLWFSCLLTYNRNPAHKGHKDLKVNADPVLIRKVSELAIATPTCVAAFSVHVSRTS